MIEQDEHFKPPSSPHTARANRLNAQIFGEGRKHPHRFIVPPWRPGARFPLSKAEGNSNGPARYLVLPCMRSFALHMLAEP